MQMSKFFELAIADSFLKDSFSFKAESSFYPPHNILKHNDNKFVLELAVAGFTQEDLHVVLDKNTLVVTGNKKKDDSSDSVAYLHKGIGTRSLNKSFVLERYLVVKDVKLSDGILKVTLERVVPEEEKPRILEIG
jgi:molecular chaperone IbpA